MLLPDWEGTTRDAALLPISFLLCALIYCRLFCGASAWPVLLSVDFFFLDLKTCDSIFSSTRLIEGRLTRAH